MTATLNTAALERLKERIRPLIDEYLEQHPDAAEQYRKAAALAEPVTAPAAPATAPGDGTSSKPAPESASELPTELPAIEDESAADEMLAIEAMKAALAADDKLLGLAELVAQQEPDDSIKDSDTETHVEIDQATMDEILLEGPTEEHAALGISCKFEYDD